MLMLAQVRRGTAHGCAPLVGGRPRSQKGVAQQRDLALPEFGLASIHPGRTCWRLLAKKRVCHAPEVVQGMPPIDDLVRLGQRYSKVAPNPGRRISQCRLTGRPIGLPSLQVPPQVIVEGIMIPQPRTIAVLAELLGLLAALLLLLQLKEGDGAEFDLFPAFAG